MIDRRRSAVSTIGDCREATFAFNSDFVFSKLIDSNWIGVVSLAEIHLIGFCLRHESELQMQSQIEGRLLIYNCAYTMDGGSIHLFAKDSRGTEFCLQLPQHGFEGNFSAEFIPGRLHLNGRPIAVRSNEETDLMERLLESAVEVGPDEVKKVEHAQGNRLIIGQDIADYFSAIEKGPSDAIVSMVRWVIDFVQSESYVSVAKRFPPDWIPPSTMQSR